MWQRFGMGWLSRQSVIGLLMGVIMAGCAQQATPIAPTQTLIPPTPTATATAPRPTPTPVAFTPIARQTATTTPLTPLLMTDVAWDRDLIRMTMNTLAQQLAIPAQRVQLAQVEKRVWGNRNLSCNAGMLREAVAGYRFTLLVGTALYAYHTDGVQVVPCGQGTLRDDLLIQVDPIAAELAALAQQQVAQTLDLSSRRVTIAAVEPVVWEDTGLGCPQEGMAYEPATIEGYRIIVQAGGDDYVYHSNTAQIFPCVGT